MNAHAIDPCGREVVDMNAGEGDMNAGEAGEGDSCDREVVDMNAGEGNMNAGEADSEAINNMIRKAAKEAILQISEATSQEIRDAGSVQSLKIKNKTALNDLSACAFTRAGIQ